MKSGSKQRKDWTNTLRAGLVRFFLQEKKVFASQHWAPVLEYKKGEEPSTDFVPLKLINKVLPQDSHLGPTYEGLLEAVQFCEKHQFPVHTGSETQELQDRAKRAILEETTSERTSDTQSTSDRSASTVLTELDFVPRIPPSLQLFWLTLALVGYATEQFVTLIRFSVDKAQVKVSESPSQNELQAARSCHEDVFIWLLYWWLHEGGWIKTSVELPDWLEESLIKKAEAFKAAALERQKLGKVQKIGGPRKVCKLQSINHDGRSSSTGT